MRRLLTALLCALLSLSAAQAQTYRPGFSPGFRSGFQFLSSAAGALCPNNSLAYYDFVANTGCSAGTNAANSTANLTTSRASIGYDLAATTQFAANVARRTGAGLLDEVARTNLVVGSQDLSQSAWIKRNANITAGQAAPDGTSTASLITNLGAGGAGGSNFYQLNSGTTGQPYSPSFWIKRVSTSGSITLDNPQGPASGEWIINLALVPDGWQRITATHPAVTINNAFVGASSTAGIYLFATSGTVSFNFWGAQSEQATTPTSYIPTTTAAATRAADNITLTLPSGVTKVDLVYSTGTTTVTVSPGTYTLPPNPANSNLLQLKAYAG